MTDTLVKKIVLNHNEKMEEVFDDKKTDLQHEDKLFYKSLKEDDDLDDEIIEKIRMHNIKRLEELEKQFKSDIQQIMFEYSKNICSDLYTFILEKEQEQRNKAHIEVLNEINKLDGEDGEDDDEDNDEDDEDNDSSLQNNISDLFSSITSDSSVYENGNVQDYFNKFNTMVEHINSDNNSDSDNDSDNDLDNDSDNNQEFKEQLETMSKQEIKDMAKTHDIVLSKRMDGTSKKKTKDELIEELLLKIN